MGLPTDFLIDRPEGWKPDWLSSDFSTAIIKALGSDNVCFVGGVVRDSLLGLAVADVDMATSHTPETVQRLLNDASIKTVPTGFKHGTITAMHGGQSCEITTLRRDVATDGRYAEVEFTDDWQADAERRDFTINALYVTPEGNIFDPMGGVSDLHEKKVRFIGNAEERIEEDALRILRFYRFSAKFAEKIDEAGQAACKKSIEMLDGLSIERIRDELLKIFMLADIRPTIFLMQEGGVMRQLFGNKWQPALIETYCANEARLSAPVNPLARLYMLVSGLLSATETAKKFKLSNQERRFLVNVERANQQSSLETERAARRALYLFGKPATLAATVIQGNGSYDTVSQVSHEWSIPIFPLKGRDLIKNGVAAGPKLGEALARLENSWIEGDFSLTKAQLLKLL